MKILFSLALVVLTVLSSRAQDHRLPFVFYGKKIFIQLAVKAPNQLETFVFDTGASSTVIDSTAAQRLGIVANYSQAVTGASGQKLYQMALDQQFFLGDKETIKGVNCVLVNLERLKQLNGHPFSGIIGKDLLDQFAIHLDFEKNELLLFRKGSDFNHQGYQKLAFEFGNFIGIPQFEVQLTLQNGEMFKGKVFMDSGAGATLVVNTKFKEQNKLAEKVGPVLESQGTGLGHNFSLKESRAKSLGFGSYQFDNFCFSLSSDQAGVNAFNGYLGILGIEFLKRFHIFLDYSQQTLYLKPNRFYQDTFDIPRSGLRLIKKAADIFIENIAQNTPASQSGLQVGDQILQIEQNTGTDLESYRALLRSHAPQVSIQVQKTDGKKTTVFLPLRDLL
jgi:Aspartyl protease/PDZ domain